MDKKIEKAFNNNRNIFLYGPGGTGKTTAIKEYIDTHPNTIVCATTGIAAINIGGVTVHKAFGIPVPTDNIKPSQVPDNIIRILSVADAIIIDEISMCRNDVFAFMVKVLRRAEKKKGSRIKLIVSGDFYQLAPVVRKADEKKLLKQGYDISGFPFTTSEWASLNFQVIEFDEIKRQNEEKFIKNLNLLRKGDKSCVPYFNKFVKKLSLPDENKGVVSEEEFSLDLPDIDLFEEEQDYIKENFGDSSDVDLIKLSNYLTESQDKMPVYICGTNAEADLVNDEMLNALGFNYVAYKAKKKGRVLDSPADDIAIFKVGERVMFTVNDHIYNRYQNGVMGWVKALTKNCVVVEKDDGETIAVWPHIWSIYNYKTSSGKLEKTEVGKIAQIPLKPAWAITIHKSQGKTFDNVVISPKTFAAGQLYVALSRVRSTAGLVLTDDIQEEYIIVSDIVDKFIENGFKYEYKAQKVSTIKSSKETKPKRKTTKKATKTTKTKAKTTTKKRATKKVVKHNRKTTKTKRKTVKKKK